MRFFYSLLHMMLASGFVVAAQLDDLPAIRDRTSHRASSADPTGGNADSLVNFEPKSTRVLLDTSGPGCIRHMWMTLSLFPNHTTYLRDLVVRMYWERSEVPSVEVPLGDFFAQGHCHRCPVQAAPIVVGQNPGALNCYWPMPFYRHARFELYNSGMRSIRRLYFQIDYELGEIPGGQGLFHAAFRRDRAVRGQSAEHNLTGKDNYVILDTQGEGQYVGCVLCVDGQRAERWYEGDDMIFIDGAERPTLAGTGTEDYFCNAWGYKDAFCYPYYGAPLLEKRDDGGIYATLYRFHIPDPVQFKKNIRVTIEHVFEKGLVNDYSSVAYWYQLQPIRRREPLPENNYPLVRHAPTIPPASVIDLNASELESFLLAAGIRARAVTTELSAGYTHGGYLEIHTQGRPVELPLSVPAEGLYRVEVKPVLHFIDGQIQMGLKGAEPKRIPDKPRDAAEKKHEGQTPFFNLGTVQSRDGRLTMIVSGADIIGLDQIRIYRHNVASLESGAESKQGE